MTDYLAISQEPIIWLLCGVTVFVAMLQTVLFAKLAKSAAEDCGIASGITKTAFRIGMISAIGPTCGIFIVMVGLISALGAPVSWMRLAVVGGVATELAGAINGATAAGVTLGGDGFNLNVLVICLTVMVLNGAGWLISTAVFTPSLASARKRLAGGDDKWLGIITIACSLGIFSYLCSTMVVDPSGILRKDQICACLSGAISMILIGKLVVPKHPSFAQYSLGIAMIIGIAAGLLCDAFAQAGGAL